MVVEALAVVLGTVASAGAFSGDEDVARALVVVAGDGDVVPGALLDETWSCASAGEVVARGEELEVEGGPGEEDDEDEAEAEKEGDEEIVTPRLVA